jgi:hypothetical protein
MPNTVKIALDPSQAVDVRLAREALAASLADKNLGRDLEHRAKLEYHVWKLLELVAELTGDVPAVSDSQAPLFPEVP